eukprot:gene15625-22252_t
MPQTKTSEGALPLPTIDLQQVESPDGRRDMLGQLWLGSVCWRQCPISCKVTLRELPVALQPYGCTPSDLWTMR